MKRIIVIAINMAVCTVGISILLFAILLLAGIRPYVVLSWLYGACNQDRKPLLCVQESRL